MGLIVKQTLKGSIFIYLGTLIGGLNVVFLYPKLLGTSNWGDLSILLSIVELSVQLGQVGTPNIILKYFPKFAKQDDTKGFYTFLLICNFIGLILSSIVFIILRNEILSTTSVNHQDLPYIILGMIIWLFTLSILNNVISLININYKTAYTSFLREFALRIIQTLGVCVFLFYDLSFVQFFFIYVASFLIVSLIGLEYALRKNFFKFQLFFEPIRNLKIKEYLSYGSYSILSNFGMFFIARIDIIMIGYLMTKGSENAGIYRTSVYIATLCIIPLRPFVSITNSLVSNWWQEKAKNNIQEIYNQSAYIGLFVSGFGLFFILLNLPWLNTLVFKEDISKIFFVICFFGIGQIFNSTTSINGFLISLSKYYKYNTYFIVCLIGVSVVLNLLFIHLYGIIGAAIATTISQITFNLLKYYFLKKRLDYNLKLKKLLPLTFIITGLVLGVIYMLKLDLLNFVNASILSVLTGTSIAFYMLKHSEIIAFLKKKN